MATSSKVIPSAGVFVTAGDGAARIYNSGIMYRVEYEDGETVHVSKNSLNGRTNLVHVKMAADEKR